MDVPLLVLFVHNICLVHVIWTGRQMMKFVLNFEYFGCCVFKMFLSKSILVHLQEVAWFFYKNSTVILSFFDTAKNKKVNKQSNFDANFYIQRAVQICKWHDPDIIVQNPIIKVDSTEAFHNSSYALYFSLMNIITFFKSVCHVTGKMFIEKLLKKTASFGGNEVNVSSM